jgi:OOP family OmpA-OmpF porin
MLRTTIAVALLATSGAASAQGFQSQGGFQFGAAIGQSSLRLTSSDIAGSLTMDDIGMKVFGGYRFNQYFALEASYTNGGTLEESEGFSSIQFKPKTIGGYAIGTVPLNHILSLHGRVGIARWESDLAVSDGFTTVSANGHGSEPHWGVGASATFQNVVVRAEFERMEVDDDLFGILPINARHQLISLGVAWNL